MGPFHVFTRDCLLFERIYEDMALYSVRGPTFVPCSHLLHHIEDDMEWLGSLELDHRGMYQSGLPKCRR